jgi:hypothetical protein
MKQHGTRHAASLAVISRGQGRAGRLTARAGGPRPAGRRLTPAASRVTASSRPVPEGIQSTNSVTVSGTAHAADDVWWTGGSSRPSSPWLTAARCGARLRSAHESLWRRFKQSNVTRVPTVSSATTASSRRDPLSGRVARRGESSVDRQASSAGHRTGSTDPDRVEASAPRGPAHRIGCRLLTAHYVRVRCWLRRWVRLLMHT